MKCPRCNKDFAEGRDMYDLLDERKLEIDVRGVEVGRTEVRLRKLVPYPLTVRIHMGTQFVSTNTGPQKTVTAVEESVRIFTADWKSVIFQAQPDR